jgi:hypothetical protein
MLPVYSELLVETEPFTGAAEALVVAALARVWL